MDYKVIININNTNLPLYKDLFARAYQAMEAKYPNELKVTYPEKAFRTIEEYFAHLEFLQLIDPMFLLIPLEEPAFEINANTRKIKAPQITTIQNDQLAEMVVFTIDRYFDYMDLASDDMNIYVQWTLPSGINSASEVTEYIDTTIPGKIRIGWPLQKEITAEAGDVHYSVRFWKEANINGEMTIVYSFNTLPEKFTVSKSLQVNINDINDICRPHHENLFVRAIKNSQLTDNGPIPATPSFGEPGENLVKEASLNDNGILNLRAQAVVTDAGTPDYTWYFTPAKDDDNGVFKAGVRYAYNESKAYNETGDEITLPGFASLGFENNPAYVEIVPKDGKLDAFTQYYELKEGNYVPYTSATGTVEEGVVLYERYTTLKTTETNEVVAGVYQVSATNVFASGKESVEAFSNTCTLVGPSAISFVTDLPETYVMTGANDKLSVVTNAQPAGTQMSYVWEYSATSAEDGFEVVADADENVLTIENAGWYKVTVTASLNKEHEIKTSSISKVIGMPIKPVIAYGASAKKEQLNADGIPVWNTGRGDETFTLDVEVTNSDKFTQLNSEEIAYVWSVSSDLGNDLSAFGVDPANANKAELTINNPADGNACNFYCKVINKLAGKEEESETLQFIVY